MESGQARDSRWTETLEEKEFLALTTVGSMCEGGEEEREGREGRERKERENTFCHHFPMNMIM